jgi:hypothetical protein
LSSLLLSSSLFFLSSSLFFLTSYLLSSYFCF